MENPSTEFDHRSNMPLLPLLAGVENSLVLYDLAKRLTIYSAARFAVEISLHYMAVCVVFKKKHSEKA